MNPLGDDSCCAADVKESEFTDQARLGRLLDSIRITATLCRGGSCFAPFYPRSTRFKLVWQSCLAVRATCAVTHFPSEEFVVDLFDFFFPEQAQATHLRTIARKGSLTSSRIVRSDESSEIEALQEDVNFLTLVIAALLRRSAETETASLADVQDLLDEIDALDGVADGGLDPRVLRGLLGVLKEANDQQADRGGDEYKIVTTPRYRKR